jgi:WD40 repeat protein
MTCRHRLPNLLAVLCFCLSGSARAQDKLVPPDPVKTQDPLVLDERRKDRAGEPLPPCAIARFRCSDKPGSGCNTPIFSPDSKLLAALGGDVKIGATIVVWNIETGNRVATLPVEDHHPSNIVFSANSKEIFSLNNCSRTLVRWDLATQKPIYKIGVDHPCEVPCRERMVMSPDGRMLFADNVEIEPKEGIRRGYNNLPLSERLPVCWETASGKRRGTLPSINGEEPIFVTFTPDSRQLVLCMRPNLVLFWDLATERVTRRIETKAKGTNVSLSGDGRKLAVNGYGDDNRQEKGFKKGRGAIVPIEIWDLESGECVLQMRTRSVYAKTIFSPDGRFFVIDAELSFDEQMPGSERVTHERRGPALWDASTGEHLGTLIGHKSGFRFYALSPDGKYIATGTNTDPILLWDVAAAIRTRPNTKTTDAVVDEKAPVGRKRQPEAPAPEKELGPKEVSRLWTELADADAAKADRAMWALALHPKESVPLLGEHLKPVEAPTAEHVAQWIADLDSPTFKVREAATEELDRVARLVAPALRKALAETESKEARRRLEELVKSTEGPITEGVKLRSLHAIEALEHAGTSDAVKVLRRMAGGAEGAPETEDAKLALQRLAKRSSLKP